MRFLIPFVVLLLAGCVNNLASSLVDECYYDEKGAITNRPCVGRHNYTLHKIVGVPKHKLSDYKISYMGQHKYSAVENICKVVAGKVVPGCAVIDHKRKKAVIWYVYGDELVKLHEEQEIIYEY